MDRDNEAIQRQKEIYEHLAIAHIFSIIILMLGLVIYKDFVSIYPAKDIRLFILLCLLCFIIVFLYNTGKSLIYVKSKLYYLTNLLYITIPLLISVVIMFIVSENCVASKVVLILPVLIAASVMGKNAGLVMSTVCVVILLLHQIFIESELPLQALEKGLIEISMMYLVGWYIGVLTESEVRNREKLKTNLLSLKKEIARRKQVEEQLRKLSSALEQSPSMIVITDTEGCIEYVNQKFTGVTGYLPEEVVGRNIFNQQHDQNFEQFRQMRSAVYRGEEWREEILNKKKNGESYWEYVSFSPFRNKAGVITHLIRASEDITEHKNIEKEMARLERLNLVGEMAAGIGHEIRNPMTSVRGFLQLLGGKKECTKYREYFQIMIDELDRANSIITEYLNLAKNKAVQKRVCNLKQILTTMYPLIEADAIKADHYLKMELSDVPDLLLDEKEIRQVVLNLVRNGLEAMPHSGILVVKTFTDGDEVVLAVQDQGKGIEPALLEKIDTPFFTTKDDGTGLGLPVCYSIAARHNAAISIDTGPAGTTFYVRFKIP